MSTLSDLYAQLDELEALNARTLPELVELEQGAIIPYIKSQRSLNPMDEPTEAIARFNAVRAERWPALKIEALRIDIARNEAQARALLFHIAECDKEIARMDALPRYNEARAARLKEEIAAVERVKAAHTRKLEVIGTPRQLLASDSMKVTV